jgi:choline dehydrogenase-like flavoprotein
MTMFTDARTIPAGTTLTADVCTVGAGAAGISIARELAHSPLDVCLLESGGLEYDLDTQQLYRGRSVGFPYFPLEIARLRFFGGTTNHWGGASRPLDDSDFEARDWVPHSGWPFRREALDPYYRRAHGVLELGPYAYDAGSWTTDERRPLRFEGESLRSAVLQQSPPTRLGQVYREELRRARNIRTCLNANLLEIETAPTGGPVTRLRVASLERNEFYVEARAYVLATGGIENPRLLLLSRRADPAGLGNEHDLVGRFCMDHPIAAWGKPGTVAPYRFPLRFYAQRGRAALTAGGKSGAAELWGFITPTAEGLRRERMLNWAWRCAARPNPTRKGWSRRATCATRCSSSTGRKICSSTWRA